MKINEILNESEKKFYNTLIQDGWKQDGTMLLNSKFSHNIEFKYYPYIQLKEDGKETKPFNGFCELVYWFKNKQ